MKEEEKVEEMPKEGEPLIPPEEVPSEKVVPEAELAPTGEVAVEEGVEEPKAPPTDEEKRAAVATAFDKAIAGVINLVGTKAAKDRFTPLKTEEVSETGFGNALVLCMEEYVPQLAGPKAALVLAAVTLTFVVLSKIEVKEPEETPGAEA